MSLLMADCSTEIREQVAKSRAEKCSLAITGSGSYGAFLPGAGDAKLLRTTGHTGIIDYDHAEMVVTVRAGTLIADLEAVLAEQGQQLGVETPLLSDTATIGGAIAVGISGSARPYRGALRDFVLGARLVNGLGEELRFGGQVMKNVAGYDLSRMLVGSHGSLGVITELSLRVLPLPERSLSMSFEFPDFHQSVKFADELLARAEPLTAASFYRGRLFLRFCGRSTTIERLQRRLEGVVCSDDWWSDLRQWRMPWGYPTCLAYRDMRFREPQTCGEWLSDWNGALVWSTEPEPTADIQLQPARPGCASGLQGQLEQRLRCAFDPEGIFRGLGNNEN